MTKKEYLRKKKLQKQSLPVKKAGAEVQKASAPVSYLSDKEFVLQDPDLKSFKDTIVLEGRSIARICENGVLRTKDIILSNFMRSKGYILINNEE
jgi:hypothetical protein